MPAPRAPSASSPLPRASTDASASRHRDAGRGACPDLIRGRGLPSDLLTLGLARTRTCSHSDLLHRVDN